MKATMLGVKLLGQRELQVKVTGTASALYQQILRKEML